MIKKKEDNSVQIKRKKIEYRPVPIRELLTEMKNIVELQIDLAFSAVFFQNKEIAEEVIKLEEIMHNSVFLIEMNTMLAVRDAEDAQSLEPVIRIAYMTDKISDAAADIAGIIIYDMGLSPSIQRIIQVSKEPLIKIEVSEKSSFVNKTIGELNIRTKTGSDIIAIRRGKENRWKYDPGAETKIKANDILIARGPLAGNQMLSILGGEGKLPNSRQEKKEEIHNNLHEVDETKYNLMKKAETILSELKNKSESMVGLAFSALLFDNDQLAEDVLEMEMEIDELYTDFQEAILETAKYTENPKELIGMLHLGGSSEIISDAASQIAEIVLHDLPIHPVFKMAIEEADETITRVQIQPNSYMANKKFNDLNLAIETGMRILAIKRDYDWIYNPRKECKVIPGDVLIGIGPEKGKKTFINLATKNK
ncbi:MAG TPA: TrkA C-terminal domain-containing protein [Candidatus Deferrimicrobium sp.]|nr:TrkA C-terminal domain-containing protein [Candidatus Deferrimicrobium sp.]